MIVWGRESGLCLQWRFIFIVWSSYTWNHVIGGSLGRRVRLKVALKRPLSHHTTALLSSRLWLVRKCRSVFYNSSSDTSTAGGHRSTWNVHPKNGTRYDLIWDLDTEKRPLIRGCNWTCSLEIRIRNFEICGNKVAGKSDYSYRPMNLSALFPLTRGWNHFEPQMNRSSPIAELVWWNIFKPVNKCELKAM